MNKNGETQWVIRILFAGDRGLSAQLDSIVTRRLDTIIRKNLSVLVGDAYGPTPASNSTSMPSATSRSAFYRRPRQNV